MWLVLGARVLEVVGSKSRLGLVGVGRALCANSRDSCFNNKRTHVVHDDNRVGARVLRVERLFRKRAKSSVQHHHGCALAGGPRERGVLQVFGV